MSMLRSVARTIPRRVGVRGFNLPRPNIHESWEVPQDKAGFLAANSKPLVVKLSAVSAGGDTNGRGVLNVDDHDTEPFSVTVTAGNAKNEYLRALVQNLIWSTSRAWTFNGYKAPGIQVNAPDTWGESPEITVTVDSKEGSWDELTRTAVDTCTLLRPVRGLVKVTFAHGSTGGAQPTVANDFLVRGFTALLQGQSTLFGKSAEKQNVDVNSIEFTAEVDVDTRGFVYGAQQIGVSPKAKDIFFRARVDTNASLDDVKSLGQQAGQSCPILAAFTKDGTNLSARWTK
jgi:hypothetical protein